jgi:GWxTD domain-containing protein
MRQLAFAVWPLALLVILPAVLPASQPAFPASPDSVAPADSADRLEELRHRIAYDRFDYQARIDLADLLAESNDIELRREAMEALDEALLIDDSDPDLWVRVARLQERRGFRRESRNAYHTALRMESGRSDLWSELAHHEFHRYQKYKRSEFYYKARSANNRSLELDPENVHALRHAVRMAYIAADLAAVDSLCTMWEKATPENGWPDLIRGLLCAEVQAWDRSKDAFDRGLAKLSELERKPFVRLNIVNPAEEDRRRKAAPDTMRYFQDYWRWRDPTPADDVNERLIEHYRRMVQAELLFALDYLDLPGWKHDPGEMIVRYGLPNGWEYNRNVVRGPERRLLATSTFSASSIMIAYGQVPPPMFFEFVDYNLSGRYITPIKQYPTSEDFFLQANPVLYEALLGTPELGQEAELWRFVDGNGKGRIEVAVALPSDMWPEHLLNAPHLLASKITEYDETWNVEDASVGSWAVFERDDLRRLVGLFEIAGTADSVIIGLETADREKSAHAGGWMVLSPRPAEDNPLLSDVAFLTGVSFDRPGGTYGRGFGAGLPNPGHRYRAGDPIGIAFEAYHLEPTPDGSFRARLHVTVGRQTRGGFLNILIGRGQSPPEAEIVFDVSEPGTQLNQLLSIDVPTLDPGIYALKVQIEDLVADRTVDRTEAFTVLQDGEIR